MTIVRSCKSMIQGADFYTSVQNTAAAVGSSTIRVPSGSGSFSPTASMGKIRVKFTNGGTGTSLISGITGTDGTNVVRIYTGDSGAVAAGQIEDLLWDFITDLNLTSINVNYTVGVVAAVADVEIVYSS